MISCFQSLIFRASDEGSPGLARMVMACIRLFDQRRRDVGLDAARLADPVQPCRAALVAGEPARGVQLARHILDASPRPRRRPTIAAAPSRRSRPVRRYCRSVRACQDRAPGVLPAASATPKRGIVAHSRTGSPPTMASRWMPGSSGGLNRRLMKFGPPASALFSASSNTTWPRRRFCSAADQRDGEGRVAGIFQPVIRHHVGIGQHEDALVLFPHLSNQDLVAVGDDGGQLRSKLSPNCFLGAATTGIWSRSCCGPSGPAPGGARDPLRGRPGPGPPER